MGQGIEGRRQERVQAVGKGGGRHRRGPAVPPKGGEGNGNVANDHLGKGR